VFARSATATLPPARCSAIMPEPTTPARSIAVPRASAAMRRPNITMKTRYAAQHDRSPEGVVQQVVSSSFFSSVSECTVYTSQRLASGSVAQTFVWFA
jgi:hypothetical protein